VLTFILWLFKLIALISQGPVITDGYCYPLSVMPGDSLNVYFNAVEKLTGHPIKLYDLDGKEVYTFRGNFFPQEVVGQKPWETGFGYKPSLKTVAPRLKSGVYLWENKVPVIIRMSNPKIVVVYTSNTENAYCNAGGKSLYGYNSSEKKPAPIVSFKRPINLPKHSEAFFRWFAKQNYKNVGYITDAELDNYSEWKKADLLMIVGHSEYWTLEARRNFDRFVNDGKNAMVLSGNTMWWQVRYSKNNEQLIGYKLIEDPVKSKRLKTINWNNPQLEYPILSSIGAEFPRAGYGRKEDKGWDGYKIITPSPLLEGTKLKPGDLLSLASDESDGAPLQGFNSKGYPIVDRGTLGFEKIEIVGFDRVFRVQEGIATWIVMKRTKSSGIIINVASTDWCSSQGMGNADVQKITLNMINKLQRNENVFSPEEEIVQP
jgi:hypothetical protein